jgi:hypothetical protein
MKQPDLPENSFDAYDKNLAIQEALGSQRKSKILEEGSFESKTAGWKLNADGTSEGLGGVSKVSAYLNGAQSLTSTPALIDYDVETYDVNSEFASAVFTAKIAGYYHIDATIGVAGGASGEVITIFIKKNSDYQAINCQPCVGSTYNTAQISHDVYLAVGDTLSVYGAYSTGTLAMVTGLTNTKLSIHSI